MGWRDYRPVVSWLVLRGKCGSGGTAISRQHPSVQAVVARLWIAAVLAYGPGAQAVRAGVLGTVLLGIAIIDLRHKVIPDELNYGGLVLGLALSLAGGHGGLVGAVLGAAVGGGVVWVVRGVGAGVLKQEERGWGDVKMMAMG